MNLRLGESYGKKNLFNAKFFFAINPNVEATPNTAEASSVEEQIRGAEAGSSSKTPTLHKPGDVASKPTSSKLSLEKSLKQMEFHIIIESYDRLLSAYKMDYDIIKIKLPNSFSDRTIEKATKHIKSALYSSNAHIREWQIDEQILKTIDKKIDNSPSVGSVIDYLRSFRDRVSKQLKINLLRRRKLLTEALKIAADLDVLKTVYNDNAYRSVFQVIKVKKQLSLCKNLYRIQDPMPDYSSNAIMLCENFVNEINSLPALLGLPAPLTRGTTGKTSIGEFLQMEKFLEDLQRSFEGPEEDRPSYFNPEDRAVFLSVLRERLDFYKNERATLEEQRAARIASDKILAEETAARIASDRAVMDLQRVAAVTTQLEEALQRAEVKSIEAERLSFEAKLAAGRIRAATDAAASATASVAARIASDQTLAEETAARIAEEKHAARELEVITYAKCVATRDLYSLYHLEPPAPADIWQCENIYPGIEKSIGYELAFLCDQYYLAESILAQHRPIHPWLMLDLYMKALQSLEKNIIKAEMESYAKNYIPIIKKLMGVALKEVSEKKEHFSEIFKQQILLMLNHAVVKGLVNEHTLAFCAQGSNLKSRTEQSSLKDRALCQTTFHTEWTDYLDNGFITPETMINGLSKLRAWEANLRYPLNYQKFAQLLPAAWSEICSPRQQQKCIYIGTSHNHPLTIAQPPKEVVDCFIDQIACFVYKPYKPIDNQNLSLTLQSTISDDVLTSKLPIATTETTQHSIQPPHHQKPSLNLNSIISDNGPSTNTPIKIAATVQPSMQATAKSIGFYAAMVSLGAILGKIFSDIGSTKTDKAALPSVTHKNEPLALKQEQAVLSK